MAPSNQSTELGTSTTYPSSPLNPHHADSNDLASNNTSSNATTSTSALHHPPTPSADEGGHGSKLCRVTEHEAHNSTDPWAPVDIDDKDVETHWVGEGDERKKPRRRSSLMEWAQVHKYLHDHRDSEGEKDAGGVKDGEVK